MKSAKLDLVLVNPGNRQQIYQSLGSELAAIEPPIWVGLLATFVRKRGYSVEVVDAEAEGLAAEEAAARVEEMDPRLVGIVVYGHNPSASTQVMAPASSTCRAIKERSPHLPTILLGGHVAALPERTLREESADFVCSGEGPYTLVDLLAALSSNGQASHTGQRARCTFQSLAKVRGLGYFDEQDHVQFTPAAPLVTDLDHDMPGMAWDLLPMHLYRAHNWHCFGGIPRQPYGAVYTTLGCPYHCNFCCIQAPFKEGERALGLRETVNSYRFWSPQQVISWIDELVNDYGVTNLRISDEMFVLNNKHVHGICDLIIERGYQLNIWAYARVDTVRGERTVEKLKQAGFNWLCFGIEAANEKVREDVHKGFHQDDVFRTVEKVRAAGINVIANFIFGLPEDDLTTMEATLKMALDLNCEFANFYCAMAYPGSQLYRLALAKGWELPETWSGYSQHSVDSLPLPTNYLSAAEVLRFRDNAFQTYFSNPAYLRMIEGKFGLDTVEHIKQMTSHRLKRRQLEPAALEASC